MAKPWWRQSHFQIVFILATLATATCMAQVIRGCEAGLVVGDQEKGEKLLSEAVLYFPNFKPITELDPHVIHLAPAATLAQNLYSRLVSLDDSGQVSSDLADEIKWDGRAYRLHIRPGIMTVDGHLIGPEDVLISLKRIYQKNKSTHGNLRLFLCDQCVRVEGEEVVIEPLDPALKTFLIQSLANVDFAIIPKVSLDLTRPDWPVKDWRNTSGIYYVHQDAADGRLILKINPRHHFYNGKQPATLRLRPGWGADAVEAFNKGEVDIIPTVVVTKGSAYEKLDRAEAHVFTTEPIYLTEVVFSSRGLKKLSVPQRLKAGQIIKAALLKAMNPADGKPTNEFFPNFSEGALTGEQRAELQAAWTAADTVELPEPVTFGVYPSALEHFRQALKDDPRIIVQPTMGVPPWLEPEERQPDVYFVTTDSGFYESLSLLHYNIETGTFMDRAEGEAWLAQFIRAEKPARIQKLKELHLRFLTEGRVIPISSAPYVSVARKPLKPAFSPFYAGSPLWKLSIEEP